MSAEDFAPSLAHVLVHEGGYSNDPDDAGGATFQGITHDEYDAYRERKGEQPRDIRGITSDERDDIYRQQYWSSVRADELPAGIDYCVFDFAVNSGPPQAVKILQRSVGFVGSDVDGHIGMLTLEAVKKSDQLVLISTYCEKRREFLRHLKNFPKFGGGWIRRVNEVEAVAKTMAASSAPVVTAKDDGATIKAMPDEASQTMVSPETATATTASSGILSGLTDQLQGLSSQLSPFQDTLKVVKYILIVVAVIAAGVTIYTFWKRAKTKEAIGA